MRSPLVLATDPQQGVFMQLRVARLCLDCEELHSENTCPRCASGSYAFLSTWLPSDERRRWRKTRAIRPESRMRVVARVVVEWFQGGQAPREVTGPLTRRSDLIADLTFDHSARSLPQDRAISTTAPPPAP